MKNSKRCRNYMILSMTAFMLAVVTLMPLHIAEIPNFMGYVSACPRAPISTLMLVGIGAAFVTVGSCARRSYMEYKGRYLR